MHARTRSIALALTTSALAVPLALAAATPAAASGKATNCTKTSTTYPGIVTTKRFAVGAAGTAVVRRDSAHDGLVVGKVVAHTGWKRAGGLTHGPKVSVEFQNTKQKIELEAAQSAQYYGPDVLVIEIKTCAR